jgi:hypothetical protein
LDKLNGFLAQEYLYRDHCIFNSPEHALGYIDGVMEGSTRLPREFAIMRIDLTDVEIDEDPNYPGIYHPRSTIPIDRINLKQVEIY